MFCENCGAKLALDAKFCDNCGNMTENPQQSARFTVPPRKSNAPKIIIGIMIGVIAMIAIGIAILMQNHAQGGGDYLIENVPAITITAPPPARENSGGESNFEKGDDGYFHIK